MLAARFPIPEQAPGVAERWFSRYGGIGQPPGSWDQMTPELIARGAQANLSLLCQLPAIVQNDSTETGQAQARDLFLTCARRFIAADDMNRGGTTYMVERTDVAANALVMRDAMQEAGIYDEFVRIWMLEDFLYAKQPSLNMDWMRARLPVAWALVAAMQNGPEKLYRLRLLLRATNAAMLRVFTPDGGGIHHTCDHLAYGAYSLVDIVTLAKQLYGTSFELSAAAHERLRAFARAHAFGTLGQNWPGNLRARAQFEPIRFKELPTILGLLSQMGHPLDREMAALYLAKAGANDDPFSPLATRCHALGVEAADLSGHYVYPVSAAALHRRDDWLVTIDGARQDRRGIEIYAPPGTGNSYTRNSCFGSIMITTRKRPSAYGGDGWDFNFYAGVTSVVLPPEMLTTAKRTGYVFNQTHFASGTSLGGNGVWGMVAKGTARCNKSAFCFDNRITLLTSDIEEAANEQPVVTTLFQFALPSRDEAVTLNGAAIRDFPHDSSRELDAPMRLQDNQGNSYVVHPTRGETLRIERLSQSWPFYDRLRADTPAEVTALRQKRWLKLPEKRLLAKHSVGRTGDFVRATINHSDRASEGRAAFTILVGAPPPAEALPQQILRQDSVAHVLRDEPSKTTGYVVFQKQAPLDAGPLLNVSRECVVMVSERPGGRLAISAATSVFLDQQPVILWIAGAWADTSTPVVTRVTDDHTELAVPLDSYLPSTFVLQQP